MSNHSHPARRTVQAIIAILILMLALPAVSQAADPLERSGSAARPAPEATQRKLALGVSMDDSSDLAAIDAFTASVGGQAPALWSLWSPWSGDGSEFPDETLLDGLADRHAVPIFFWFPTDEQGDAYSYRSIARGDHDAYVRTWAKAAKKWAGTVLVKFAPEMNGPWFPWGIKPGENSAKWFKAAWKRIHTIIRGPGGVGATNVKMVWSPYSGCGSCPKFGSIFPGDKYVEYVGFSAFDWGGSKSMKQIFKKPMAALRPLTHKKVIVTETGTPSSPGNKAAWLTAGYNAVYKTYPTIVAIVYFSVRVTGQPDWRLTSPSAALAAYADIVAKTKFQGRIK